MDASFKKPGNIVLIAGVVMAVIYYPVIGKLVFGGRGYSVETVVGSRLIIWLEVLLLYFYSRFAEKTPFLLWPEKKYKTGFYLASFGALYLLTIGAGILSHILTVLGMQDDRTLLLLMTRIVAQNWPLMIFTAATAGITEELILRGYVLPRLEVLFKNKYMPVIISALAFGLMHFRYGSAKEIIFATLFGIVFAIHYQWYRNIRILMFTHAAVDFVSVCVFKLAMHYHLPVK